MRTYTFSDIYYLLRKYNKDNKSNIDIYDLLDINKTKYKYKILPYDVFKKYDPKVLYEDDNYYGVYKPPYWQVTVTNRPENYKYEHPSVNKGKNLFQNWLYSNLNYELRDNHMMGYGICNRLDVNTSGVVLVARNKYSYKYLRGVISRHLMTDKRYFTIVEGSIENNGIITTHIDTEPQNKSSFSKLSDKGKPSITKFYIIAHLKYKNRDYTLLDVHIKTGRTHQIRVHMNMLSTHIIGDNLYNDVDDFTDELNLTDRIFLHAYYYRFQHWDKTEIPIYAPLASDLLEVIDKMELNDKYVNDKEKLKDYLTINIHSFVEDSK